jgi:hypothetical protein
MEKVFNQLGKGGKTIKIEWKISIGKSFGKNWMELESALIKFVLVFCFLEELGLIV